MTGLIIFCAKYMYIFIVLAGVISILYTKKKADIITFALPIMIINYLLAKISGIFIKSPRPFIVEHIQPLINTSADNGFPSDHTLLAMTVAIIVFTYNKKLGSILIVLAVVVGVSRVLTHSHHVIDIVGSIIISLAGLGLVLFLKRLSRRRSSDK